ncbi:MFS transporter [Nocardiopsis coralliicola]
MAATTPSRPRWGAPPAAGIRAADPAPFGWAPLAVLFLVGLVDRIEHQMLSGVLPLIQAEWGISDTLAGSIPTAAAVASALVALPAGFLADRRSRTRIITVVVFCWALAALGSGLAVGFAMFYAMRVLLAAAEQIDNPASSSLLADYYPQVSRPKVYGLVRMTTYLGGIGTLLGGVLGEALGWRGAFVVMAIPGLITALVVWRLREPPRGVLDAIAAREQAAEASEEAGPAQAGADGAPAEAGTPAGVTETPRFGRQLSAVLRNPTLVLLSLGLMMLTAGLAGTTFWMPSLIARSYDVGTGAAGSIAGLSSVVGVIIGTLIGSWLGRRAHGAIRGGRVVVAGSGVVSGSLLLVGALMTESTVLFTVLLTLTSVLSALAIPCVMASVADVVGADTRGLGFAFLNFLLTIGAAVGPMAVGYASDATGSLHVAFYILTVPKVIGGLAMLACWWTFDRDARRVLDAARE